MIKKLLITTFSFCLLLTTLAQNGSVKIGWDPVCNTNVTQYIVYYGTNVLSTPVTNIISEYVDDCGSVRPITTNVYKGIYSFTNIVDGINNNIISITNLVRNTKYYFVVTCKAPFYGVESPFSKELEIFIPPYGSNTIPSRVQNFKLISVN